MGKIIKHIGTLTVFMILSYLIISFVALDFNLSNWNEDLRITMIFIGLLSYGIRQFYNLFLDA